MFCNCNNLATTFTYPKRSGVLNPQSYKFSEGMCETSSECNNKSYTIQDARLFDNRRAIQTKLDVPPYDGSVWMDDVYNSKYVPSSYNNQYSNYEDITSGQIRYYIDPEVAPAIRKQIYNLPNLTYVDMYKTPMNKIEPMFYMLPYKEGIENSSCDSFTRDQLLYRNDLISLQQRGHNKQRYEAIK